MALTAEAIRKMMPDLEAFLSMKASEQLDSEGMGGMEEASTEAPSASATPPTGATEGGEAPGMGVVIALKPKGGEARGGGEKVPGCPDCEDGTPHQHVK